MEQDTLVINVVKKKLTLAKRKELYSELYFKMEEQIKKHNPCKFTKCGGRIACLRHSVFIENNPLCCYDCRHLSLKKGCRVQSLSCKLWFCIFVYQNICSNMEPEDVKEFMDVREYVVQQIKAYGIPLHLRCSKSENFRIGI